MKYRTVTCNDCQATNLAWDKTRAGKWALREVMYDRQTGEVLGAWHDCRRVKEVRERMKTAEVAAATTLRNRERTAIALAYMKAHTAGDAAERARLGAEMEKLGPMEEVAR
jgi:hypothetical protein